MNAGAYSKVSHIEAGTSALHPLIYKIFYQILPYLSLIGEKVLSESDSRRRKMRVFGDGKQDEHHNQEGGLPAKFLFSDQSIYFEPSDASLKENVKSSNNNDLPSRFLYSNMDETAKDNRMGLRRKGWAQYQKLMRKLRGDMASYKRNVMKSQDVNAGEMQGSDAHKNVESYQ